MNDWLYIVLIFVNVVRAYVYKEGTLTTVSITEFTSPIPTLMYRRMGFQQEDLETPTLVLRAKAKSRRSKQKAPSKDKQWSWDKWCLMQRKPGDCKEKQNMFYYDTQIDECRDFVYTGCNGNENRFGTRRECEQFCKGFGMVMHAKALTRQETCSLQPDPGMCLAAIGRYYFDITMKKCRPFVFGGCGGNSNRFLDEDSCLEKCVPITGARSEIGVMKAYDFY